MASFKSTLISAVRETDRRSASEKELALLFALKVLTRTIPAKRMEAIFKAYEAEWQEERSHARV